MVKNGHWRRGFAVGAGIVVLGAWSLLPTSAAQTKTSKQPITDIHVGPSGQEQIRYIDELLEKGWKDNKITPSDRCTDYEFIRRASLDIIGRIAKVHEISKFMSWPASKRRSMLIEHLLDSPEYAGNWANVWTNLMLTRSGVGKMYHEQFHAWMEEKLTEQKDGKKGVIAPDWSKITTEILTASGRTNDNSAVNFILAHMGEPVAQDKGTNGVFDFVPVTSRTTRIFLGLRTQCVQCHDHPFNGDFKQEHFWGINAFFRQTDAPKGRPTMMAKKMKGVTGQQFELRDDAKLNPKGIVPYERRSGVLLYTDATFLKMALPDGVDESEAKPDLKKVKNRRAALANFVTKSPYFSKAYVNRVWGHFFGKSFTKDAVDDFGDHNPPSNPDLLERLAKDWATRYQHNPKDLIRWICNSRAYGLSSIANKTNDKVEDEVLFSRMLLKAMTPEQMFESLMVATDAKVGQAKASRQKLREEWLNKLVVNFGNDEGEEGSYTGTVVQALLQMNGQDINKAIMDEKDGTVADVLQKVAKSPKSRKPEERAHEAMKDLFLAALNRPPTAKEYKEILSPRMYQFRPEVQAKMKDAPAFWKGFYQDMFWALLNSGEFVLNH